MSSQRFMFKYARNLGLTFDIEAIENIRDPYIRVVMRNQYYQMLEDLRKEEQEQSKQTEHADERVELSVKADSSTPSSASQKHAKNQNFLSFAVHCNHFKSKDLRRKGAEFKNLETLKEEYNEHHRSKATKF